MTFQRQQDSSKIVRNHEPVEFQKKIEQYFLCSDSVSNLDANASYDARQM